MHVPRDFGDVGVPFPVVIIAGSSGGIQALAHVLPQIPDDFPAAVVIAQHRAVRERDLLPLLLQRRSRLPVILAADGDVLRPGFVYVSPPKCDVEFEAGRFAIRRSVTRRGTPPREADVLMRAAAREFGARTVAVVLTGLLDDGAEGCRAIKRAGGMVLAQEGASAFASAMPQAASATGCVDHALSIDVLPRALVSIVMVPGAAGVFRRPAPDDLTATPA